MSTLYIDRKNTHLDCDAEALVFYENGTRIGTIPLGPLSRIIVRGGVTLDTSLLGKLGAHGVGLIVLSGRRAEPALMLPCPHNDAARRIAQYRAVLDEELRLLLAQDIVSKKLARQRHILDLLRDRRPHARYDLSRAIDRLDELSARVSAQTTLDSLRGIEGAAARFYFSGFASTVPVSLGFHGRNRRPPRDPMNAVLSLGYTLLHAEAVLAAHAAGLDPAIGFYHDLQFGRESLACDLIEPLRCDIDLWARELFAKETLRPDDFTNHPQTGCFLGKAGRARFYQDWERIAEHLRKVLEEDARALLKNIGIGDDTPKAAARGDAPDGSGDRT